MSNRLERYRALGYELPDLIWRWELDGPGFERLRLVQVPRPRPAPDEVAFRVDVNTLCFSDIKVIRQAGEHPRLQGYDVARNKVVPGHEMSITITEVGSAVADRFRPGQRWTVQPDINKYRRAVGYDIWGGLAQFGVFGPQVQEYLLPLRSETGYSAAALSEPWACVEASYRRVDLVAEDEVVWLVGGAGPMGQMHLIRALEKKRAGGAPNLRMIIVTDISSERLADLARRHADRARDAGVSLHTINTAAENLGARLRAIAPQGVSYAIGLCPVPEAIVEALRYVRPYGVLSVFAGLKRGTGQVTLGDVHYDSVTITGNSGSTLEDMQRCLALAERGALDTDAAVGAVAGLRAAHAALLAVAEGRVSNKIAIYPQLTDLPLTPVEALPDVVDFPSPLAAQLRAGRWSRTAEAVMLEKLLQLG